MLDVAKVVARELFDRGKGKSPEPTTFTGDEMLKYFPDGTSLGINSRCRAERGRRLGWTPLYGTRDMLASIRDEVDAQLASGQRN